MCNYNGKAVPMLKHRAMKTRGGVEIQIHEFLTPDLEEDEWPATLPRRKDHLVSNG
jgi:hypothetical protein